MSLIDSLQSERDEARKAHNSERLSVLQVLCAALKNAAIDKGRALTDDDAVEVIARMAKQTREALADFEKGGRADLAEKARYEISALEQYLPEQISDVELVAAVSAVIAEVGASGPGELGRVMGAVMNRVKGKADGGRVRTAVQKILGG